MPLQDFNLSSPVRVLDWLPQGMQEAYSTRMRRQLEKGEPQEHQKFRKQMISLLQSTEVKSHRPTVKHRLRSLKVQQGTYSGGKLA